MRMEVVRSSTPTTSRRGRPTSSGVPRPEPVPWRPPARRRSSPMLALPSGQRATTTTRPADPVLATPDEYVVAGAAPNLTNLMTRATFAGAAWTCSPRTAGPAVQRPAGRVRPAVPAGRHPGVLRQGPRADLDPTDDGLCRLGSVTAPLHRAAHYCDEARRLTARRAHRLVNFGSECARGGRPHPIMILRPAENARSSRPVTTGAYPSCC